MFEISEEQRKVLVLKQFCKLVELKNKIKMPKKESPELNKALIEFFDNHVEYMFNTVTIDVEKAEQIVAKMEDIYKKITKISAKLVLEEENQPGK